jgi:hypothetical protein
MALIPIAPRSFGFMFPIVFELPPRAMGKEIAHESIYRCPAIIFLLCAFLSGVRGCFSCGWMQA